MSLSPEMLRMVDQHGKELGIMTKAEGQKSGGYFEGILLCLHDKVSGDILLQQRNPQKSFGGRWDVSVAGHRNREDETIQQTAIREAREELGIELTEEDLTLVNSGPEILHDGSLEVRQYGHMFFARINRDETPIKLQQEEVCKLDWVPKHKLIAYLMDDAHRFVPRLNVIALYKASLLREYAYVLSTK